MWGCRQAITEVNMARTNDSIRESKLDGRYGEIGISAVAAALQYKSNMNFEAVEQRRSRRTGRQMSSKSQTAWETAARCAALARDADDDSEEREYYVRLRRRMDHVGEKMRRFQHL